jgi:hypothetical protein
MNLSREACDVIGEGTRQEIRDRGLFRSGAGYPSAQRVGDIGPGQGENLVQPFVSAFSLRLSPVDG